MKTLRVRMMWLHLLNIITNHGDRRPPSIATMHLWRNQERAWITSCMSQSQAQLSVGAEIQICAAEAGKALWC